MESDLRFERLPALPLLYLRGALSRKPRPRGPFTPRIPPLQAGVSAIALRADVLQRYRQVCAAPDTPAVPLTYPHVMATPLHAALVMDRAFPYPVLGLVHVRQQIVRHGPIAPGDRLSIHCRLGDERPARRGVEFDTLTEVRVAGDLVWESVATALVPGAERPRSKRPGPAAVPPPHDESEQWELAEDLGRRYAAVTHDYNPIHLWPATARVFGFKRPIIHGMWSVARAISRLTDVLPPDPMELRVEFRRPVPLPSRARLCWTVGSDGVDFALRTDDGARDHLRGTARSL